MRVLIIHRPVDFTTNTNIFFPPREYLSCRKMTMMLSSTLSRKSTLVALKRQDLCSLSTLATTHRCQQGRWLNHCSTKNTTRSKTPIAATRHLASNMSIRTTAQMAIHRLDPITLASRSSSVRSFSTGGGGGQQLPPWMHPESNKPGHYLSQYCTDLTSLAEANKLDPVIGRHEEIRRCLQILARRTKSNPVCKLLVVK